jgi:NAD(P)-dependent dehydrogenase (short-subunit alcohol dehydrogenase family)
MGPDIRPGGTELAGRTVLVIGGTSGIGLETARRARAEGADVIVTARDADRLKQVALELGARAAAFDATDFGRLGKFFDELPAPVDHVLVTGPGPYYAPLADFEVEKARHDLDAHVLLAIEVARHAARRFARPGLCSSWEAPAAAERLRGSRSSRLSRRRAPR